MQLWARSPDRAQTTLADIRKQLPGVRTQIVNDLAAAVSDADLIICLTPATQPILSAADVRPGHDDRGRRIRHPGQTGTAHRSARLLRAGLRRTDQCADVGELHHALDACDDPD